ncbi:hypothetical protein [Nitrosospira briensis]|uniref:hypothetical protein n=1 Tax=Nitrosospira briensis TaxID=35799 RepID=UPI0008F21BD8|nr:hypothetical protein [Nitrosospira briensis]SFO37689.1 hypothetical protein SAMN05216332_112111 [Nitrosospira briensis]
MSYTSESELPGSVTLVQAQDLISLLDYKKSNDDIRVPNRVASYYWYEAADYKSYTGVGLDLYRDGDGKITVTTRSRASRSYWDLLHQNKTLKMFRDLFGGNFTTDAGRNRYWRPNEPPPTPLSSGCFTARWGFHNGLGRASIYLMNRKLEGQVAQDKPSGLEFMDELNPRLLSNNFLLPYIFAVWEEYFRATFSACLKYSAQREAALKRARLSHRDLEKVAIGSQPIERAVAESFSFQRPSAIHENFRMLDQKLDIGTAFRKPYRRRTINLFASIEALVENRNEFVHTGRMNTKFFDKQLKAALSDMEVAVNRAYEALAAHYRFVPNHNY